jgi:hypothetical protein
VEPFAKDTTKLVKRSQTRSLEKLMTKYKENLNYYATLPLLTKGIAVDIIWILSVTEVLQVMKENGDLAFYNKETNYFQYLYQCFERFGREKE